MLGPAAQAFIAILAHIGGPLLAMPHPDVPPVTHEMTVTVRGDTSLLIKGQIIRYQVMVLNVSSESAPVSVRLSLTPGMLRDLRAAEATVIGDGVAWRSSLEPGEARTFVATGTFVGTSSVSAIACVESSCASDYSEFDDPSRTYALIASIVLGILAALGSIWLYRMIRPEFLTPEVAASTYGPEQPGGAPSA